MMKKVLAAAALASCALSSQAEVSVVAANTNSSTFLTLSGANTYSTSSVNVRIAPFGTVGNFIAAGATPNANPVVFSFTTPTFGQGLISTSFVSFLWGTPDVWNKLEILTDAGVYTFDKDSLDLPFTFPAAGQGSPTSAYYVGFQADGGELIESLSFYGGGFEGQALRNAFEASNFSVTPVPEPETYALMLAGLGVVGFMARRRKAA